MGDVWQKENFLDPQIGGHVGDKMAQHRLRSVSLKNCFGDPGPQTSTLVSLGTRQLRPVGADTLDLSNQQSVPPVEDEDVDLTFVKPRVLKAVGPRVGGGTGGQFLLAKLVEVVFESELRYHHHDLVLVICQGTKAA